MKLTNRCKDTSATCVGTVRRLRQRRRSWPSPKEQRPRPPSHRRPTRAAGDLEIVWVEQGAGNPYWDAQHAAAAEAADRLGFDFRVVSGDLDPAVQASVVQQTVDQGPDAIMVNAIDPSAIAEAYQYAADNGVPIVNLYGLDEGATAEHHVRRDPHR